MPETLLSMPFCRALQVVVLHTSYVSNALVEGAWRKLETTMENKGIDCAKVDGADPEMKDVRSALWEVSQKRGYPLVFTVTDGKCEFVGDWDHIQVRAHVNSSSDPRVASQYPRPP